MKMKQELRTLTLENRKRIEEPKISIIFQESHSF